jgi:hypothetical protein
MTPDNDPPAEVSHLDDVGTQDAEPSKWARLVAEIESRPSLGDYADELRRSQKEFRRNFRFKHDKP